MSKKKKCFECNFQTCFKWNKNCYGQIQRKTEIFIMWLISLSSSEWMMDDFAAHRNFSYSWEIPRSLFIFHTHCTSHSFMPSHFSTLSHSLTSCRSTVFACISIHCEMVWHRFLTFCQFLKSAHGLKTRFTHFVWSATTNNQPKHTKFRNGRINTVHKPTKTSLTKMWTSELLYFHK